MLQLPLNLSDTHSVLAPDGSANLGFVAANGPVGLEAVRIHRWRVRRLWRGEDSTEKDHKK